MQNNVVIVTKDCALRDSIRDRLDETKEFFYFSSALSSKVALESAALTTPDIVIFDMQMKDMPITDFIKDFKSKVKCVFIGITNTKDIITIKKAFFQGLSACLYKPEVPDHLIKSLTVAVSGHKYLSPSLMDLVVYGITHNELIPDEAIARLTPREREILVFVAQGLKHHEIADKLIISPRTVDVHIDHINLKLGLPSTIKSFLKFATEKGLGEYGITEAVKGIDGK